MSLDIVKEKKERESYVVGLEKYSVSKMLRNL